MESKSEIHPVSIPPGALAAIGQAYMPFSIGFKNKIPITSSVGMENSEEQKLQAMRTVLDNAKPLSDMYGTAEELLKEVNTFSDFQGNNKFFGLDGSAPYSHTFQLYDEIRGDENQFILKNDIFLYLQNKLIEFEPKMALPLPLTVLMYFMKSQEAKIKDVTEFVQFEPEKFTKIDEDLQKLCITLKNTIQQLTPEDLTPDGMLVRFKKLIPVRMINREMTELIALLEQLFAQNSEKETQEICTWVYSYCAAVIPALRKIIVANPNWFNPEKNVKCTLELMERNLQTMGMVLPARQFKKIIRVFQDGDYSFVLLREAIEYLETFLWDHIPKYEVGFTAEFRAAINFLAEYDVDEDDVIYISVPVKRAKHSAVLIPTGYGQFCKLASDWFFEVFRNVIFGIKAFQGNQRDAWKAFEAQLGMLKGCFNPEWGRVYTRNQTEMDKIQEVLISTITPHLSTSLKDIRPVSAAGFTAENLHEELSYLTVDTYFSEIHEHVDVVYKSLLEHKKTSDMYTAVENCLMLALLKRNPWMVLFLHGQVACHRVVGLKCFRCELERRSPHLKRNLWNYETDEDHREKSMEFDDFMVENRKMEAIVEKRLAEARSTVLKEKN